MFTAITSHYDLQYCPICGTETDVCPGNSERKVRICCDEHGELRIV